jgi:hypothetical protein
LELNLLDAALFDNCIIFNPEIVIAPQFHVIGREHQLPYGDSINQVHKKIKMSKNVHSLFGGYGTSLSLS